MTRFLNTEQLANELDRVQKMSTSRLMTGWFSKIDEQVLKLIGAYPQLREPHDAFTQARRSICSDRLTDQSWEQMKQASRNLAAAARELGNIDIVLCERPTEYSSMCGHALTLDGSCLIDWHIDT